MLNVKKLLEKIVQMHKPAYMEIQLSANTTVSPSAQWSYVNVPLNAVSKSYGTGLTFTSNGIRVDNDGYYRISANLSGNAPYYAAIYIDNTSIIDAISNQSGFLGGTVGSVVRYITAGSIVRLKLTKSTETNPLVAGPPATSLSVERLAYSGGGIVTLAISMLSRLCTCWRERGCASC